MKEFLVGLLFLVLVLIMTGIGILLFPLLLLLTLFVRVAVGFFLVLFAIWLFGKCIVVLWDALFKKS